MKDKKTEIQINKKDFYRNLTRLALPIALQSLMLASVAAGDALMLGKVAQDEMTAVSLATQIQFVQNMFLRHHGRRRHSGRPILGKRRQTYAGRCFQYDAALLRFRIRSVLSGL